MKYIFLILLLVGCDNAKRPDSFNKDVSVAVLISDLHAIKSKDKQYFYSDCESYSAKDYSDIQSIKMNKAVLEVLAKSKIEQGIYCGFIALDISSTEISIMAVTNIFNHYTFVNDEDIELSEIGKVKISKYGILANKKTKYYNEKMSEIELKESSFEEATHLILEDKNTTKE